MGSLCGYPTTVFRLGMARVRRDYVGKHNNWGGKGGKGDKSRLRALANSITHLKSHES